MFVKLAILLVAGFALLAWLGKWLNIFRPRPPKVTARRCPSCGTWLAGKAPCACGKGQSQS